MRENEERNTTKKVEEVRRILRSQKADTYIFLVS